LPNSFQDGKTQNTSSGLAVAADLARRPARDVCDILIADTDQATLDFFREQLLALGHEVRVAKSGPQLIDAARQRQPQLVVTELQLPGMDGIAAADEICRQVATPVVLVSRTYEPLWVARALGNDCIVACLTKPLDASGLWAALAVAMRRFERMEALRADAAAAQQALDERKLVERAKGAVMHYAGVDEEEAYKRLRKSASKCNQKLCEISRDVLNAAQTFRDLESGHDRGENGHSHRYEPRTTPSAGHRGKL